MILTKINKVPNFFNDRWISFGVRLRKLAECITYPGNKGAIKALYNKERSLNLHLSFLKIILKEWDN